MRPQQCSLEENPKVIALCMLSEVIPERASIMLNHAEKHIRCPLTHVIPTLPQHRHHDLRNSHVISLLVWPVSVLGTQQESHTSKACSAALDILRMK